MEVNKGPTDYVDVATRLVEFREKHPEGSLQPANPEKPFDVLTVEDSNGAKQLYIVYVAAAYRHPDDTRPGIGCAYEYLPGRTNFTRGSELQNAETSAWGRAIMAALAADSRKGIASAEEVRNRQAEREPQRQQPQGSWTEMRDPYRGRPRKQSELDAERNPENPEAERQARLEEQRIARDALGVDSTGRLRKGEPRPERVQGRQPDDEWTVQR